MEGRDAQRGEVKETTTRHGPRGTVAVCNRLRID